MKKTLVSAALLAAMAGSAGASTFDSIKSKSMDFLDDWNRHDFYLGILISNSDLSEEDGIGQDMSVLNATFGYVFPKGFALEARFGAGTDQPDSLIQDPVTTYSAAMLRYHYTWSNNVMAYAGVGTSLRTHSDAVEVNDIQAGGAFAFGLNLFGTDQTAVNIEYLYLGGPEAMRSIGIGFHRYYGKY